jgi:hypothetical protein
MTSHDAPTVNFQALLSLAMTKTIYQNILVLLSDKQIYPINNSKADKVEFATIAKLVFTTHVLKLKKMRLEGHKRDACA